MIIKVLGTGCKKCNTLFETVEDAITDTGVSASLSKEENIYEIMKYGVMTTPALVIDEQVVVKGKIPSSKEIQTILKEHSTK